MVHDIYEVLVLRMKLLRPGLLAWFRRAAEGGVGVLSNVPKQAVDLVPCFLLCGEQGVNVLPEVFGQVKDAVKVSNRFPNLSRLRADELECSLNRRSAVCEESNRRCLKSARKASKSPFDV